MKSDLLDRLNSISDEEWDEMAKRIADEQEQKVKKLTEFFASDEFFVIYYKILEYIQQNDMIQCEDYNYPGLEKLPITYDEYEIFTDSISEMTKEEASEDQTFPSWYHDFYDIRVDYISGQGTISRISLNEKGIRNKKLKKILK